MKSDESHDEQRRKLMKVMAGAGSAGLITLAGCSSNDSTQTTNDVDQTSSGDADQAGSGERVPELEYVSFPTSTHSLFFEGGRLQADALRELGLKINFSSLEVGALVDAFSNATFEDTLMIGAGSSPVRLDPDYFLSRFSKDNSHFEWGWDNEEYEQLLDEQRQIYDTEERREVVYQLQEVWANDQPGLGLYRPFYNNPYNKERVSIPEPVPPGDANRTFWTRTYIETADGVNTVSFGATDPIDTLNAISPQPGIARRTIWLIHDMLFRINREGVPEKWMVEEYEAVDDTTIEMTLRDDLTFHDGEKVTASDVKFTYEAMAEASGQFADRADVFESIEAESDTELRFNLPNPYAPVYHLTFSYIPIIPEHIWSDVDDRIEYTDENYVGSGPWKFNYWRRTEELSLTAFENHFNPPSHEEQLMVIQSSISNMIRAIRGEELDVYMGNSPPLNQRQEIAKVDHVGMQKSTDYGNIWMHHDLRTAPFDDVEFRKAMGHANPMQQMIDTIVGGDGTPVDSPVTAANEFWHNPDITKRGDDIEKGRQVLEEAGYSWDEDGRLHYPPE